MDDIEIKIGMEGLGSKTDKEKIDLLLQIAYANYSRGVKLEEVVLGDGNDKVGLCEKVRKQGFLIAGLWTLAILTAGSLTGVIIHILRTLHHI